MAKVSSRCGDHLRYDTGTTVFGAGLKTQDTAIAPTEQGGFWYCKYGTPSYSSNYIQREFDLLLKQAWSYIMQNTLQLIFGGCRIQELVTYNHVLSAASVIFNCSACTPTQMITI